MTLSEEIRRADLAQARAELGESIHREALLGAFEKWWGRLDSVRDEDSAERTAHPPAERLAEALRIAGMEEAAQFAIGLWVKQKQVDRGMYLFAVLLGESFVGPFTDALLASRWRAPYFFGLETLGAWESFYPALRERLRIASDARNAAMSWLNRSAQQTIQDPLARLGPHEDRGNLRERITKYGRSPDIEEAWEHPYDPPFLLEDALLWTALLEVRPAETLALIGSLPHPAFMRNCLGGNWLAEGYGEVGPLIVAAPAAFDGNGNFRGAGAVALQLLDIATDAVDHIKRESEKGIQGPIDKPDLLEPVIARCKSEIEALLERLFARHDAIPLAWAWLERLTSHGKKPSPPRKASAFAVHISWLFIAAIAQRLHRRDDWKEWILQQNAFWRIHRLVSVLAVGALREEPDTNLLRQALEWALTESDLDCPGLDSAIGNEASILTSIGGRAISALPDPIAWFANTWADLRPVRERNWRSGTSGGKQNSMGELLVVWGLSARGQLVATEQKAIWKTLERSIRDAWQTDTFGYAPIWSQALILLFDTFDLDKDDSGAPAVQQLADALLPYIAASHGFLLLVISLTHKKWSLETMRDAVTRAGFDLARLVQNYLQMKELVFGLPQADKQEIGGFRELAKSLSTGPAHHADEAV